MKILKSHLSLLFIIILAFLLRIVFINQIPPGIANDEINILINAQSFLKTGQNIPGVVTGIIGNPTGDLSGGIHSEISSYLLIPFIFITGFSWPFVKLGFVFFSIGIIIVSYLIVRKVINKEAANFTAFIMTLNPWTIFFGRSAYESIISSFFYLLGIYLVIALKGWKILLALPIFILGFLSYFSAKTLLLPIILVTVLAYRFFAPKTSIKSGLILIVLTLLFLVIYLPILKGTSAGARFEELNNTNLSETVNLNRSGSLTFPFVEIFENKATVDIKQRLKASFGGLSLNYLFLDGQPESIPSLAIPSHGFLYLIDLPLIILGLIFLARNNQRFLFLILGLVSTTFIPNFLNLAGTTYSIRTVILFPTLAILSSIGLYALKTILFKNLARRVLLSIIVIVYLIFVCNFVYQYFSRLPIDKNEGWFLQERIASNYINKTIAQKPLGKIYFATANTKHSFYRYLLFSNSYQSSNNITLINEQIANQNYMLGNVIISDLCPEEIKEEDTYIVDATLECKLPKGNSITSIKDAGTKYIIVNDKLCDSLISKRYPHIKNVNLLNIENLSTQNFCENFITNPDKFQ